MSCPNTPRTTNGAHYRGPMYFPVEEDSVSPPPLLTGFYECYNGAPWKLATSKGIVGSFRKNESLM
ncbi:hypothetical protein DSO57_1020083 [Entomophthora muscae]|uniref:Uncharacterized protein n=1 Tax=Entomophthora muscae TaxID=34485 RepID=A0ACC2T3V9_9FUNG|nr:hypothetical protein DSO57_1020083 [Entomophthora muscae]